MLKACILESRSLLFFPVLFFPPSPFFLFPSLPFLPRSSLHPRCSHSFLRLVEKSSVVNGNSGFIVPRQTMPGNIIKTFRRNILTLTHRFTVRQTFRSSTPPLRLRPRLSVTARLPALPLSWLFMSPPPLSVTLFALLSPSSRYGRESAIQPAR